MREEIRDLQRDLGLTVVYVTHDQQEAMAVSDRIIVMNAGRIEQQGAPRDLYEKPATPFLARFMGESNPARGTLRRLDAGRVSVTLGDCEIVVADSHAADGETTVAIRPEAIAVETAPGPAGALGGTLAKASYLGTHMEYSIETAAGRLFATCPHTTLNASELGVGLPQGQMGNSEVGHINIGAGRIVYQDLTRVDLAIANGELMRNPVLGPAALMGGYASGDNGVDLIRDVAARVAAGRSLLVFPEGTRTARDVTLNPLKPGFALIASRAHAPIRVIIVRAPRDLVPKGWSWWRAPSFPSEVEITLLGELDPLPGETAGELTLRASREISSALASS